MIGNECFQDLGSYLHANDEMTVVGIIFNGGLVEIASLELVYSFYVLFYYLSSSGGNCLLVEGFVIQELCVC